MGIKIKEATGIVKGSSGEEAGFNSISELLEIVQNKSVAMPEYIFIYAKSVEGKAYQMVLDFNSVSERSIDIESLRKSRYQKYLGDILIEKNLITKEKLDAALKIREGSNYNERLGEVLVRLGYVTGDQIILALHEQFGFDK